MSLGVPGITLDPGGIYCRCSRSHLDQVSSPSSQGIGLLFILSKVDKSGRLENKHTFSSNGK